MDKAGIRTACLNAALGLAATNEEYLKADTVIDMAGKFEAFITGSGQTDRAEAEEPEVEVEIGIRRLDESDLDNEDVPEEVRNILRAIIDTAARGAAGEPGVSRPKDSSERPNHMYGEEAAVGSSDDRAHGGSFRRDALHIALSYKRSGNRNLIQSAKRFEEYLEKDRKIFNRPHAEALHMAVSIYDAETLDVDGVLTAAEEIREFLAN